MMLSADLAVVMFICYPKISTRAYARRRDRLEYIEEVVDARYEEGPPSV